MCMCEAQVVSRGVGTVDVDVDARVQVKATGGELLERESQSKHGVMLFLLGVRVFTS